MNILYRPILFIFISILNFNTSHSQGKDNLVRDTVLSKKLRKYLIEHIDVYTLDSIGKKVPLDVNFILEEYGQTHIVATNLKTDSIITDKNLVGVYSFRFADVSSRPHLYIKYSDKIEFIDLDAKEFRLEKLLQKIIRLFNKYPNQFTLQEKVKATQGVMETIYFNKFVKSSW